MRAFNKTLYLASAAALLCASCAISPDVENRRQAMEADIAEILSAPLDPAEFGETKRCLSENEYRNFRALDARHILFEGRRGKQWINTLRARCPDLRHGQVLIVRQFSGSRMCDTNRFAVADWFDWPWYRRWPWNWGGSWTAGATCSLGKFQPVTDAQVAEIEAVLKAR